MNQELSKIAIQLDFQIDHIKAVIKVESKEKKPTYLIGELDTLKNNLIDIKSQIEKL